MPSRKDVLDPGKPATPEQGRRAAQEVEELVRLLQPWNIPKAAAHIKAHRPSDEAIACLAFYGAAFLRSEKAKGHRKPGTAQDLRDFKARFVADHAGKDYGWSKAAQREFDLSAKTIAKRMAE